MYVDMIYIQNQDNDMIMILNKKKIYVADYSERCEKHKLEVYRDVCRKPGQTDTQTDREIKFGGRSGMNNDDRFLFKDHGKSFIPRKSLIYCKQYKNFIEIFFVI